MRTIVVLLFCGFLFVTYQGMMTVAADFISDLLANVERMNQEIQKNVKKEMARAKGATENALKKIKKGTRPALSSSKLDSAGTNSHYMSSGKDARGRPYYIETENVIIGDTLFHTERIYNYTTKRIDERRYTVDLSIPNAPPVFSSNN